MSAIPLHPERGLDPHMLFCPRCGGEGSGLTVGRLMVATLPDGTQMYYPFGQKSRALQDAGLDRYTSVETREVEEGEKVPDSAPCDECQKELELHKTVVAAGGVYFRCTECKQEGVVKKNPFADHVRKIHGIEAPAPCGVEFTKCEEHGGKPDEEFLRVVRVELLLGQRT